MMTCDVHYPIVTELQSNIVVNPIWSDANQKVHIIPIDDSDVIQGPLATFSSGSF